MDLPNLLVTATPSGLARGGRLELLLEVVDDLIDDRGRGTGPVLPDTTGLARDARDDLRGTPEKLDTADEFFH